MRIAEQQANYEPGHWFVYPLSLVGLLMFWPDNTVRYNLTAVCRGFRIIPE